MQCPKCKSDFEQVQTPFGDIERCTSCKGLWVDTYEQEDMKKIAEAIDIGDVDTGREMDKIDRINCPVCANHPLIRMVDNKQPHIHFESCTGCYGRFFDAGEFKDLANHSLNDFFKSLFAKERV